MHELVLEPPFVRVVIEMTAVTATKPKIKTMEELSTTIGVSRPTLSKFFQDSESVSVSMRARIEQALATVDYTPNFFATKMNRKSSRLIGVVVPYLNDLFYTSLIQDIEDYALRADYMVIVQNAQGDPKLYDRAASNLISMNADGVIIAPMGHEGSVNSIKRLNDALPILFVDSCIPTLFDEVDFVGTNNEQSIALIVDYLHRAGDAPVFLGMPRMNTNSLEREQAYMRRAQELGFEPTFIPAGAAPADWNFEEYAFVTMDEHFSRGEFINSAILCANDRLAIGAIRAANKHDLLIAGEKGESRCRIAGHDDHPLSAFVHPALTTVSQNTGKIAEAAVAQLINLVDNGRQPGPGSRLVFDAELCVGASA